MQPETRIKDEERQWLLWARKGDAQAFSGIVRLHQEHALRLAWSFLGNWEDAREAAQNAFVKAYRRIGSFRGEAAFRTWLHRIVVNECRDFLRKKKVRRHLSVDISRGPDEEESGDPAERIPDRQNPGQEAASRELGEAILRHAAGLPEKQHRVFILRYMEDLSLEEIGAVLRITTGAVKAHLWQANQKMKEKLSSYREEAL